MLSGIRGRSSDVEIRETPLKSTEFMLYAAEPWTIVSSVVADEYTIKPIPNLKPGDSSFLTTTKRSSKKLKQGKCREPKEGKGEAC